MIWGKKKVVCAKVSPSKDKSRCRNKTAQRDNIEFKSRREKTVEKILINRNWDRSDVNKSDSTVLKRRLKTHRLLSAFSFWTRPSLKWKYLKLNMCQRDRKSSLDHWALGFKDVPALHGLVHTVFAFWRELFALMQRFCRSLMCACVFTLCPCSKWPRILSCSWNPDRSCVSITEFRANRARPTKFRTKTIRPLVFHLKSHQKGLFLNLSSC